MSPEIRPAVKSDADEVVDHLYTHMSSKISRQVWARLFDYPWRPEDVSDFGRVVVDGGNIVGYLGGNYSDRQVKGRLERICNLSSAYLLKEYRGTGLGKEMYADIGRDDSISYTSFTSTLAVQGMMLGSLGYRVMDDYRYLFRASDRSSSDLEIIEAPDRLDSMFAGVSQKLRRDNGSLGVRFIGFEADGGACLLGLHIKKKGADISYFEVVHASNYELLTVQAENLAGTLLPDDQSVLAIDHRFLPGYRGTAPSEEIPLPRLVKSSRLQGSEIDNLNNEVMLFDQKFP